MTATLAPARPEVVAGRTTFVALAARETRRFAVNPVFLFAVVMTAWTMWYSRNASVTEIDTGNWYPCDLPRRVRHDGHVLADPVHARQRAGRRRHPDHAAGAHRRALRGRGRAVPLRLRGPVRVPAFPPGQHPGVRGVSPPAQVAVLVGQIVVPSLGGPLLGVALGRWVRLPGAAFVLFLVIFGWENVAIVPSLWHPDSAAPHGAAAVHAVLVLHSHR